MFHSFLPYFILATPVEVIMWKCQSTSMNSNRPMSVSTVKKIHSFLRGKPIRPNQNLSDHIGVLSSWRRSMTTRNSIYVTPY